MKKNRKIYWLFLAPSLLGVAVFYCVPFLYAAYYAVIDNIGSGQFVGLQNFIDVLQNELFRTAAKNTLIFMALTVPLGMALALLTALCLRKISRGRRTLGTVSAGDVDMPCADDVRGVFDVGRQRV